MKRFAFAVLLAVLAPTALPAEGDAAAGSQKRVSFRGDVWPIIKRHCVGCHSGANAKGGLNMQTVPVMLKGGDSGPLFEPGQAGDSLFLLMTTGDEPEMPKDQPPLSAAKLEILKAWIDGGAVDDSAGSMPQPTVRIPETYRFAPAVTSVSLSPDGKHLAAACRSEVVIVPVDGDGPPRRWPTGSDLLTHVEFSPDGKLLAAAGGAPARFGLVEFFQFPEGQKVGSRRFGHDTLFRGSFAPDGRTIALGGADGAVHMVPVEGKSPVRSFDLHSDWVLDVAFTPDGKMLISGGRDKATKVSSVETGKLLRSVDSSRELISAVATDGQFAVSGGRARTLTSYELKIALSGIQVTGAGNGARPINKRNQYAKSLENQPGEVLDLDASGDRKRIAVAGDYGDVRVYQIADRKRIALVKPAAAPVYSIALNDDGSRLALGTKSGQVQVFEIPSGKLLKSLVPVPVEQSLSEVSK